MCFIQVVNKQGFLKLKKDQLFNYLLLIYYYNRRKKTLKNKNGANRLTSIAAAYKNLIIKIFGKSCIGGK